MGSRKLVRITLLAAFTLTHSARITQPKAWEAADDVDAEAFEDGARSAVDCAGFHSFRPPATAVESPAALVQEAFAQGLVSSPAFEDTARKQVGTGCNGPSRDFAKILDYLKQANGWHRRIILVAACDSSAFSCEEVVRLVNSSSRFLWGEWDSTMAKRWLKFALVFVEGRSNRGCIVDPANAKSILDSFERRWRRTEWPSVPARHRFEAELASLKHVFNDTERLKPAQNLKPPSSQLRTGFRTDETMKKLVDDMKELLVIKSWGSNSFFYGLGNGNVYKLTSWLKQIRSSGEQFSGSQLVMLTKAVPLTVMEIGTNQAVSLLLQHLERYVAGITCAEVNVILERIAQHHEDPALFAALDALKPNIVDQQNKVTIVVAIDLLSRYGYPDVLRTEKALREVGAGLPPRNNPVFGVVEGNPAIFVLDESTSMDEIVAFGTATITRRKLCHRELEIALTMLSNGTYFNVVRYSASAVKIFKDPVVASSENIDKAMEGVSWRGGYTPGQDPAEMLRHIKMFALQFQLQTHRNTSKNVMDALKLAYGSTQIPSQLADYWQHMQDDHEALLATMSPPQIYFLTSGRPDGGAQAILDKIKEFDIGKNIPVNSISWIMPADLEAKQFAKDLAEKTGGFFRPIEHASCI